MKIRRPKRTGKISRNSIIRAVASSTAIETGKPVAAIEKKLEGSSTRFQHLTLSS